MRVQYVVVEACAACGGAHADLPLYDVISGPGVDVPEGATKAIVCPSSDYTIVNIDRDHMDEPPAEADR